MNKNTVLGFICIGLILIGFSWYNTKVFKEQQRANFVADSIARAEALKNAPKVDSTTIVANDSTSQAFPGAVAVQTYKDSLLEAASNAPAEFYTLENNKLKVVFTTKGAQASEVLVKDYYTHDSLDLYLMKKNASDFGLTFYTDQQINTSDFTFSKVAQTDSSLVMRLNFSGSAYIDYMYTLHADSYMLDFNVRMVGMNKYISRNMSQIGVDWDMFLPRLERGYDNEKNYSTIVYKYPNESNVENLGLRKDISSEELKTKVGWFAFQQQFFSAILLADNDFTGGNLSYKFATEEAYHADNALMACEANMQVDYEAAPEVNIPFQFYYGPNLYKELKSYGYGFEKIVPLGGWLIGWINRVVIINCFDFLNGFISNYGIIILLMTIFIKLVISPLTFKSYMSSAKMRVLRPEIEKINQKYPRKEDAMKKQQETMALYSKTGVSVMGGCLPMLLQFPILFAMFRFFPASFELRQQSFLWADDLSAYDSILDLPFHIPMYGDHVSLFALLMAISMYFYSKMNMDQMPQDPNMAGMRGMQLYFMPVFLLVLCNNFSSGLSYYYMLSNLITIIQTWVIRKYFVDEKKIYEQLQAKASSAKSKPKSKWQMRLEEMQKQQAELQRRQQEQRREMDRRMQNRK